MRDIQEIAADLEKTANGLGARGRPFQELAAALKGDDARTLAGVDLASAFGPDRLLPDRDGAALGLLEILRDLAVLAPPAYVAWQLYEALRAHSEGSFLAGWQQGFGQTIPTLGDTARTVALTVVAAAALYLVSRMVRDLRDGRAQRLRVRLSSLIGEATLSLALPAGARDRLTRSAALLKASLQSTIDYFAGLSAGAGGGAAGLHRNSARLARKLGLLADEIVDAALAGKDVSDLLGQFHATAAQLSRLFADEDPEFGPAAAAARFEDAVRETAAPSGSDIVPAPRMEVARREDPR
ncbi:hypothetical protein ACQPZX_16015 [Actinoplanes sp. CA-142083]|uniref:hypothetical protein n=1 Tax=Actinoplanes sp. CA-142083 TaxID=3239903 RepID=UPI003D935C5A